mgnify:CR=1 FL=1
MQGLLAHPMSDITIYHNPNCGTSRSTLALLREKGTPYAELDLANDKWTDDELLDFMLAHPILINRPVVETPLGTRLCRPSELVLDILPNAQKAAFTKEDGEAVVNNQGQRV